MKIVIYIAHVDDDVIFCGGTIAKLSMCNEVYIVYASNGIIVHGRPGLNLREEAFRSGNILGIQKENIKFLNIPTMEFESYGQLSLNMRFEALKLEPDLIITHARNDVNKDHKIVFESALVQARSYKKPVSIISCEYIGNGGQFHLNMYVDITETMEKKIEALKQIKCELCDPPHPRSLEAIRSKAFVRGTECGCNYAEAFEVIKWIT